MITELISKKEVTQAHELFSKAESVAIVTHMSPDGDAMGSALGLYHFLLTIDIETIAVVVPNRYPDFLAWMPGADKVVVFEEQVTEATHILQAADLIVAVDFNVLYRIGPMGELVKRSQAKKILIDHHPDPSDFADVTISYTEACASSELVFRLICRMGYFKELGKRAATCILLGIMTDTGNFSYSSGNKELYYIVAELIGKGVDKDALYRKVFNNSSEMRLRLTGYCLNQKMKIFPEYGTALITLSLKEQEMFQYKPGDTEGVVNLPLSIAGINFSVLMREDTEKIKISLRSEEDFACNKVAAALFNGGGHLNASGGESYATLAETAKRFEEALPTFFTER